MAGRNSRLETKWEKIARTFSRNHNINVRLTGAGCVADLKTGTIYIPANSDDYKEVDGQLLEGMIDHEWKHIEVEFTAREAGRKTPLDRMKTMSQREKLWFNAFEDYRIESELTRDYVGCGQNVAFMNDQLLVINKKRRAKMPIDPMKEIAIAVLGRMSGGDVGWLSDEAQKVSGELEPIWRQADDMKDYEDAISLAKQVIKRLGDVEKEQEQKKQEQEQKQNSDQSQSAPGSDEGDPNQGDDSDQDDDQKSDGTDDQKGDDDGGDSSGNGNGDDRNQGYDADDDQGDNDSGDDGSDGQGDGDSNDAEDQGDGDDGVGGQDFDPAMADFIKRAFKEATTDDVKAVIKEHLNQSAERNAKVNKRHIPHPAMDDLDRIIDAEKGDPLTFKHVCGEVGKQISALKSKLVSLLKARTLKGATLDRERGHLDGGALYRLKMNERNVFMDPAKNMDLDTAVSMLIDMSGSMNAVKSGRSGYSMRRIDMAARSAIALAETMEQLGVPVEITGFNNTGISYAAMARLKNGGRFYTRYVPFRRTVFKAFGDRWQTVKTKMVGVSMNGNGVNCDGEALLWAAKRLAARNERRKIFIVLSDGKPNLSVGREINEIIQKDLKDQVNNITRAGIQVIGLGIMSRYVADYYPIHTIINNLNDLPKEVFKALKRFMF